METYKNKKRLVNIIWLVVLIFPVMAPLQYVHAQTVSAYGTITLPDGITPVSNAYLYLHDSNWNYTQNAYTNSSGYFEFLDLPNNNYTLEVYGYNESYSDPDPTAFSYTSGSALNLGTIRLVAPNVTGTLVEPDGVTPISYYYINVHDSNWNNYKYTNTNSDGEFKFSLTTSGTYTFELWNSSGNYWPPDPFEVAINGSGQNDLGTIEFKNSNITGTITEPDGTTPVPNVSITVRNSNWSISKYDYTDENGEYGVYIETPGTYTFEMYCSDCTYPVPGNSQVTVVANQTTTKNVSLVEPNVTGAVTLPDGTTPVTSGQVYLHNSNWTFSRYDSLDENGEFSFNIPNSGTYQLETWAYSDGYSNPANQSFNFIQGNTANFYLRMRPYSMSGQVQLPNGEGAPYASLWLHDNSYSYEGNQWASTDENGYFNMPAVPNGSYTIDITPPSNVEGLVSPDDLSVTLYEGQTNTNYLTNPIQLLEAKKRITGYVAKPDGTRVSDAEIYAYQRSGNGYAYKSVNSNGTFSLLVGTGDWWLSVWPRWDGNNQPDWGYYQTPTKISFEEDNTVAESANANFEVQAFTATLKGRLLYPDGTVPDEYDYVSINAWSQNGGWNWTQADNQGRFTMKLPPGTFNTEIYSSNETYGSPNWTTVTLTDGQTYNIGDIYFIEKNEFIKGTVRDVNGNPLANQNINTWKVNGSGWDWQQTAEDGTFTLNVTPGRWQVDAYPSWSGDESIDYVPTQQPQIIVLESNQTVTNVNFTFAIADATISGTVQDADGNVLSDIYGWAYANRANQSQDEYWYWGQGGSIDAGAFNIKVPAGRWTLGAYMGWGDDYTAASSTTVNIDSGETIDDAIITVLPNDATIEGTLYDSDGNVVDGVWGSVFADNGIGGHQWSDINNGQYSLKVAAGTWRIGYWIDWMSGYTELPLDNNKITIASEETVSYDITLQQLDSVISGTAYKPDGTPMANAWISADTSLAGQTSSNDGHMGWWYNQGNITDEQGKFNLQVASGTYFVTGSLPPDMNYINPEKAKVTVDSVNPADIELTFRESDAKISGTLKLNGSAHEGFIWGWSEKGGYTQVYTDDGSFSLNATKNDNWHIGGIYEETNGEFYKSPNYIVEIYDNATATQNIVLAKSSITMPAAVTTTFSSANSKTISLDDGTEISASSYSFTTDEVDITVTATPTAQMPNHYSAEPLSIGYDLEARYASGEQSGQTISKFSSDITICLPYTAAQLEEAGITVDDLAGMYWDETSGTYKNLDNVIVNEENNTVCSTTDHFTSFAITFTPSTGSVATIPTLTLTSPVNNSIINTNSVIFSGTVDDTDATVVLERGSTELGNLPVNSVTGAFTQTITDIPLGENIFTVTASNQAGSVVVNRTVTYQTASDEDSPDFSATGIEKNIVVMPENVGGPQVRVFDNAGELQVSFFAYSSALRGEFDALIMDIDADGDEEIVTYPRQGFGAQIRAFDMEGNYLTDFFAYDTTFRGGITVKNADINGDSKGDLVVTPLNNGGPNVRAYTYNTTTEEFELISWFWAYDESFRGQVNLTTADVTGDGQSDIITVPKTLGGPNVRAYTYNAATGVFDLIDWYWAYQEEYRGGVNITTADLNDDGLKDVITWPETGVGSNVQVYTYNTTTGTLEKMSWFWAYDENYVGGINVKYADVNNDGQVDIITAPKAGSPNIRAYTYNSTTETFDLIDWFWAYQEEFKGGVNLNITNLDGDSYLEIVTLPISDGGSNLRVYEFNATTEEFELQDWKMVYNTGFTGPVRAKVADLDGDGDSDIMVSPLSDGGPNVRVYNWADGELALDNWFWAFAETYLDGVAVVTGR